MQDEKSIQPYEENVLTITFATGECLQISMKTEPDAPELPPNSSRITNSHNLLLKITQQRNYFQNPKN